ncbi:MAG: rhomboid family intramembrane serine protease [Ignavibacteriae bacterium]|nr:rhomboid family intramembrane serine protease [Ignavibacteriota bacterium]
MASILDIPVTITLLFANAAIYLWIRYSNPVYFQRFAEWPFQIVYKKRYYQMLTSAFLHADTMHLFFNLFALYSFGQVLETLFVRSFGFAAGSIYYILIYFISLFSGSIFTVLFHYKNPGYVAVGASGAVSGIVFSYIIFFPTSTVGFFFIPMPAFVFALLYVAASIYGMKTRMGNIGHEAHLGGAIGGVIATLLLIEGAFQILVGHFG